MIPPRLAGVRVPGPVDPWTHLGFTVVDGVIPLANGAIRCGYDDVSLEIEGIAGALDVDGVGLASGTMPAPVAHANGAVELDHVVVITDSLERTSAAIAEVVRLEQRRIRETGTVRQSFHRFADVDDTRGCIVEVVERQGAAVAIWGVVMIVDDLDAMAAASDLVGAPRSAVQPGRRIATVSRDAGLPVAVALMTR